MGRDGKRDSCSTKASNRQIFIVGYMRSVDSKHLHVAQCSAGYSVKDNAQEGVQSGVATHLNNGTVEIRRETCKERE